MRILKLLLLTLFFTATTAAGLHPSVHAQAMASTAGTSPEVSTDAIHSRLYSSHSTVTPGQQFDVLWDLRLDPHWHVYWQNPGDSGLPPTLTMGGGFTAVSQTFPVPQVISVPPVTNYGYENRTVLAYRVTAPANLKPGATGIPTSIPTGIPVNLTYLYCSDVCMPGEVSTELPVSVGQTPVLNPAFAAVQQARTQTLPQPLPAGAALTAQHSSKQLTLTFNAAALGKPDKVRFIPATEGWLHDSGTQTYRSGTLTAPLDPYADKIPATLNGLLLIGGGAYVVSVPLTTSDNGMPATATASTIPGAGQPPGPLAAIPANAPSTAGTALFFAAPFPLASALFAAFLAGLILNVMPCVLPVLSLKLMGLVRAPSAAYRRKHVAAYTLGVLASFWLFAVLIALLQRGGQQLGWGFHLQSPLFVAGLIALMIAVALNFFGVYEVGQRLTTLGGRPLAPGANKQESHLSAFATGVLAVVVATPCTVPFMGGAMAFALSQSTFNSLLVFTALGLGMALPFLLVVLHPAFLRWLPRPGKWMLTLRHLLGWPMLATGLWLLWVFINQTNTVATFLLLSLLLLLGFTLWLYGRFPRRRIALLALLPLLTGLWVLPPLINLSSTSTETANPGNPWQPWSAAAVDAALQAGRPVFIDFTADWCITCKVTEATVLNTRGVQQLFKQHNVALFKADWTRRDAAITAELARHGRRGVPLYLAYASGHTQAQVLPQLLTPGLLATTYQR